MISENEDRKNADKKIVRIFMAFIEINKNIKLDILIKMQS
jgi:hypothetical protein